MTNLYIWIDLLKKISKSDINKLIFAGMVEAGIKSVQRIIQKMVLEHST